MVVASGNMRLPRFVRRDAGVEVDRLYRRYAGEVLRYASLVLRSRADAEDITQTVFLRALRALERGERVRTPRNWLIKITHNECRRLLANRKLHIELPDEIAVEPEAPGRAEELRLALTALPATQRDALVLRELEGRNYAEIAQTLDLSESAVETLIFRARRALREQLENAISCEEFAALLEDPSARTRVRAHARVCPECATLDHQSRGRKSALRRIASVLGFPGWGTWWGAKLAAVGLTTATVAAVAVAIPHDGAHSIVPGAVSGITPANGLNLIPPPTQSKLVQQSGGTRFQPLNLVPPGSHPKLVARGGGTRFKSSEATAPPTVAPAAVLPGPEQPAPRTPEAGTPQPAPLPSPTKIVSDALPVPAVTVPAVTVPAVTVPAVTVPESVLPPVPEPPAVSVPTVSVPLPAPEPPAVTVPVEPPKVSLP
jgi:RNA polymerase sigma factor (sigma-70 family)